MTARKREVNKRRKRVTERRRVDKQGGEKGVERDRRRRMCK